MTDATEKAAAFAMSAKKAAAAPAASFSYGHAYDADESKFES